MSESFQQVIQDSLDSMKSNCNTPGNSFYLPTWLQQNNWDPYGENYRCQVVEFQMTGADMASGCGRYLRGYRRGRSQYLREFLHWRSVASGRR